MRHPAINANDQNEVRLPVVKFLASQRASSVQTLATYFIVVRLVLINRISLQLQHCRSVDYVQEPNAEPVSSRRNFLGENGMSSYCGLLKGTSTASRSRLPLVICGLGVRLLPHRALGASPPRRASRRPRYPQENLVRACASSPEISRGGHGILPTPRYKYKVRSRASPPSAPCALRKKIVSRFCGRSWVTEGRVEQKRAFNRGLSSWFACTTPCT
jgi:hypothetical protein